MLTWGINLKKFQWTHEEIPICWILQRNTYQLDQNAYVELGIKRGWRFDEKDNLCDSAHEYISNFHPKIINLNEIRV